ncbi:PHD finger 11 isoform X2 [Solea senegalensis]|uniref:PHD finger 11 isoform X2 n=1 Tax=Solea senegalensis TaxID=28829 RepID=A0AAV6PIB3_SOLSE|nr:uncharacterized protein LOC122762290 isoform X3 [Solea senegalensis]XP_043873418.1 uncharacterized protein LOC122762290 isoform X4 [Solea senegalensis]KAG7466582.1 PHD finger 11 isoform X2 [Solea senegalensis]
MPLLLFFHLAHKVTKTGNVCVSVCKLFAHYRPPELVRWKVRTHTHRKFVYTLQEVGRVLTRRRGRSSSRLTACNRAIMSKRRRRIKPVDDAKTYILSCTDKSGFMSRLIDSFKGRGVFATQPIEPGDFVLEYRGKLLTQEECQSLTYSEIDSTFLFDFEWQNRHLCLDASKEDGSLGRLVNDNHKNPNCVMRKIIVNNKPHLCLFALKKIEIGSEIDYSYGDAKWPWRSMVKTPAAAETETSPLPQMFHMESKPDETNAQVKDPQTPAAAETETSPLPQMFHMESKPDETNAQMDSGPEVSRHLCDSDETVLKEACDEASPNNHSREQSDDELVPPLRRTKSIMMDRLQDFAGCLYDSSDDSTEGTLISKPERDSQRLRRCSRHPIQMPLVESDNSNIGSEDEYIPCPKDESTESDSSLELTLEDKKRNKGASSESRRKSSSRSKFMPRESGSESSKQKRSRSSSRSQLDFSQKRPFKTGHDPTQIFPNSRVDGNEKKIVATYSKKDVSVSMPLEEEQSMYVNPVLKKMDGSRSYNKKHFCFYCRKFVQKMSRHLWRKHQDETDVAKAFSLPKNSKERKLQLDYIRNKGNFEHNSEVLETQKGKLIPWKQPQKKSEGQEFAHCIHCYGLFSRRAMWRHFQVCNFKPESSKPGKTRVLSLCAFAEPAPPGFNDAYWKFLSVMNQDRIAVAIKEARCILEYGYRLFRKNEKVVSQHQYIRQKLRELGRLLLKARQVTHVKTIQELIKPEQYSQVVTAAKSLSGFSEQTGKYQCPSLARKVGHSLYSLAMFIKSEGLKKKDKQATQDAEEFALLYQESWRFDIASQALTQLDQTKWNAPLLLPFTQDIQKFHCHLAEKQQQHLNDLQKHSSPSNWKELAKVTLTQVVLFNRRRGGEVSRMLLSAYLSKDTSDTHGDVSLALTPLEQKLCKHFVRITIVGKRGRKVPVLLTPIMRESLDALTEKREECGVLSENGYLFALPHSVHYIRACDCIRQFVNECDHLENPKALTSTRLRKHIATLSTVLNLKTTELDQLADFLGHNIAVHRKHYRLPEGTLQLAKISKVLLAMEQGRLGEYKGKSLDEIQVDVNETIGIEGPLEEDIEGEQGSEDESMSSLNICTSTSQVQNQRVSPTDVSMPGQQGSEDEVSTSSLQECTSTSQVQNQSVSARKRGKQAPVRRWTPEEIAAVEKHLKKFIVRQDVPGKADCERCIASEPQALQKRDWKAVKYFIKNRITTMRRKF